MLMPHPLALHLSWLTIAFALLGPASVQAQVLGPVQGLPSTQLPSVGLPSLSSVAPGSRIDDLLRSTQMLTHKLQVAALLRGQPERVTVDPKGNPVLRGQFLAMDLTPMQLAALQAQGFTADATLPANASLGLNLVVLHDSRRRSEASALRKLQQAAPKATFSYQHVYLPAGAGAAVDDEPSTASAATATPLHVGLIDGGVDPADPALARARIHDHGCAKATVSRHGTAVASRLVNGDPDALYVADLWCGDAVGGATSNLVAALAWMAHEQVPVINISLVGPDNPVLARAVQAMIARGHVLVAAVGNDGPAAPPLFPAAYPGVIGVSGVDARDRVLPESGSGNQVAFCALGTLGSGRRAMRGTSFAAPIVARRAAQLLDAPRAGAATEVMQQLAKEARDLGAPGRDPRYGYGLLTP